MRTKAFVHFLLWRYWMVRTVYHVTSTHNYYAIINIAGSYSTRKSEVNMEYVTVGLIVINKHIVLLLLHGVHIM